MTAGLPEAARPAWRGRCEAPSRATRRSQVRFVADLVCPWCYIAFARLGRLLGEAEVTWHPFLLNPTCRPPAWRAAAISSASSAACRRRRRLYRRIQEVGAREGIRFSFAAIRAQPNTVRAHGLVLAAADAGRAAARRRGLFRAFFEEGADIGDPSVLPRMARAARPPGPARRCRARPSGWRRATAPHAAFGINGVPITVFGEDHVIAGAQPTEALAGLIDLERYRVAAVGQSLSAQGRQAS